MKNMLCLYVKYIYIITINTCKYFLYVCVFIYIINIHSTRKYFMKKYFILDAINHD